MLTVKLVQYDGHQDVREVERVWADDRVPYDGTKIVTAKLPGEIDPIRVLRFAGSGRVYVMNDKGRTVADYFLGDGAPRPDAAG